MTKLCEDVLSKGEINISPSFSAKTFHLHQSHYKVVYFVENLLSTRCAKLRKLHPENFHWTAFYLKIFYS